MASFAMTGNLDNFDFYDDIECSSDIGENSKCHWKVYDVTRINQIFEDHILRKCLATSDVTSLWCMLYSIHSLSPAHDHASGHDIHTSVFVCEREKTTMSSGTGRRPMVPPGTALESCRELPLQVKVKSAQRAKQRSSAWLLDPCSITRVL